MKKYNLISLVALLVTVSVAAYIPANAATISLNPTADGDIQIFGGNSIDTTDTKIEFTQSGGLIRNGILEFDLSSIADGSTINSASLDIILTRFVSNIPAATVANIDLFAFNGDGVITLSDFNTTGIQVFDGTTPKGGNSGDLRSFNFSNLSPIANALAQNLLTIRIETDSFASINFASLENLSLAAATLNIDYTAPIPLPLTLPLFGTGLVILGFIRSRKQLKVV